MLKLLNDLRYSFYQKQNSLKFQNSIFCQFSQKWSIKIIFEFLNIDILSHQKNLQKNTDLNINIRINYLMHQKKPSPQDETKEKSLQVVLEVFKNVERKLLSRNTGFFLKDIKSFQEDLQKQNELDLKTDVTLECLGYGILKNKRQPTLQNFYQYTDLILEKCKSLNSLKINFNGFNVSEFLKNETNILAMISQRLMDVNGNLKIKSLQIHTSSIEGVKLEEFKNLFALIAKPSVSFSLQCASWTFVNEQPTFQKFFQVLESILPNRELTFLRLQISGWFYELIDAKHFLGFRLAQKELLEFPAGFRNRQLYMNGQAYEAQLFYKQLQIFHVRIMEQLQMLVQQMTELTELQVDMRNMHQSLKMGNLKKKLDNISAENRAERSMLVSKRQAPQTETDLNAKKTLKLKIVM